MATKRLLVLDLNGTILHRLTHAFEVKLFRSHPIVVSKKINPDITVHGSKIIFRPHAIDFLTHVLKHFEVAVWTSSRPQNALPMVHYSFKNLLDFSSILEEASQRGVTVRQVILGPSDKGAHLIKERLIEDTLGKSKLKFIWTQSECDTIKPEKENENASEKTEGISEKADGTSKDSTRNTNSTCDASSLNSDTSSLKSFVKPIRKKNLNKIYTTFPSYSPQNTLIIDDTHAKLADHLDNHLRINEFNVTEHHIDFTRDTSLLQLKKYLEKLIKDDPSDVRVFLAQHDLTNF